VRSEGKGTKVGKKVGKPILCGDIYFGMRNIYFLLGSGI
jgi:hypothetical protein